jgi:hypothetical protein
MPPAEPSAAPDVQSILEEAMRQRAMKEAAAPPEPTLAEEDAETDRFLDETDPEREELADYPAAGHLKGETLIEEQFTKKRTAESVEQEFAAQQEQSGVKELFNAKNIEMKSELNNKEVVAATRLLFMGERYDIPAYGHFVDNFLRLKVSTLRKGRREYIEGLHAEEKKEAGKDLSPMMALMQSLGGQQ